MKLSITHFLCPVNSQASFAYDGKEFNIVEEDTIVQLGGNQVILWNTSQKTKDYIQ